MNPKPLAQPCPHTATPEEQVRDPEYLGCNAAIGAPCTWARRHDGITDPTFHSERLETVSLDPMDPAARDRFDQAVLATGLV